MPRIDNKKFYDALLNKYGYGARGLGWLNKNNQQIRFDVLHQLLSCDLHVSTLVDAGCGVAHFYDYLNIQKNLPKRYIGIDLHANILKEAKARTGIETHLLDITTDELIVADYYICSGAMNILNKDEAYAFISNVMHYCQKAFAFNILCGPFESDIYNYLLESELIEIAQTLGVSYKLHQGYLKNDISMILYQGKS